jgi:hypothetical protein
MEQCFSLLTPQCAPLLIDSIFLLKNLGTRSLAITLAQSPVTSALSIYLSPIAEPLFPVTSGLTVFPPAGPSTSYVGADVEYFLFRTDRR